MLLLLLLLSNSNYFGYQTLSKAPIANHYKLMLNGVKEEGSRSAEVRHLAGPSSTGDPLRLVAVKAVVKAVWCLTSTIYSIKLICYNHVDVMFKLL
jgi:hypothetical protein